MRVHMHVHLHMCFLLVWLPPRWGVALLGPRRPLPPQLPDAPVLEGRSWGSRVLSQLVAAVAALAGDAAVTAVTVVLHVSDLQLQLLCDHFA